MPKRCFITIRKKNSNEQIDIEVPGDQPVRIILPDLLKVLDEPVSLGGRPLQYGLMTEKEALLTEEDTLKDAGVENFETLYLCVLEDSGKQSGIEGGDKGEKQIENTNPEKKTAALEMPDLPVELKGLISPILWAQLLIEQPSLISPSGLIFVLNESQTLIGRKSNESQPDIDLTELDTNLIASRKHAEITYSDGYFTLRALRTTNGTFVNGVRLQPDQLWTIRDGDVIQFGSRGVQLIFRLPHKL